MKHEFIWKSTTELSKQISVGVSNGLLNFCCFIAIGALVAWVFFGITGLGMDSTDKSPWHRSDLDLHIDALTGCQYLSHGGSLTPRLDSDGNILCFSLEGR